MRIGLEKLQTTRDGTPRIVAAQEYPIEPPRDFRSDFGERQHISTAGGTLDLEIATVIVVELLQGFHQQEVHREPDRAAPVGIAAKESTLRFRWLVIDAM